MLSSILAVAREVVLDQRAAARAERQAVDVELLAARVADRCTARRPAAAARSPTASALKIARRAQDTDR